MANTETKPMSADFPRWFKEISFGNDQTALEPRWAGVNAVADAADSENIETLIRLAFKSRHPHSASQVQKIRESFKALDATFEMQGNDREVQVLAGASLAVMMERGESYGAEAALMITTTALDGTRQPDLPIDLSVLADAAIDRIAEVNRARPDLAVHTVNGAPKIDFKKAAAKFREQPNPDGMDAALDLAAESVSNGLTMMAQQQAKAVSAMESFTKIQDEELQMLWWFIGQRSEELDCAFSSVPAEAQALVFAKELADHTESLPGPASIKGLLSRAGLKERKKITIPIAINAVDPELLKRIISDGEPSLVTTPIHYAITRKLETGENDAWIAGWAAAVGIDARLALPQLTLGVLFYRERLLIRFRDE